MYLKVVIILGLVALSLNALADNTLTEDLDRFVEDYIRTAPEDVQKNRQQSIDALRESGILEEAINVGDVAPEFKLVNAVGTPVSLYESLVKGPVVLVWYRGGWCPYCNLQLQHLQTKLAEIERAGGQVIAISPELPDKTMTTKERHMLEFEVLSDVDNKVADQYKLAYSVPEYVVDHYDLSAKLNEYNGEDATRLPLAVTYVIAANGVVEYAFLDADYKNRAAPEEIISVLNELRSDS